MSAYVDARIAREEFYRGEITAAELERREIDAQVEAELEERVNEYIESGEWMNEEEFEDDGIDEF